MAGCAVVALLLLFAAGAVGVLAVGRDRDLSAESRAIERCILLEGPADQIVLERTYSILLCNTPEGQYIYATRTTELKLP